MKYLKLFESEELRQSYIVKEWTSPHIYLNKLDKSLDYEEKYIPLQYISSTQTGGQYIDLGCKLMENTDDIRMYIKFNIKGDGKDNNYQSTLISSQPEVSPYPGFVLRKTGEYTTYHNYKFIDCSTKWYFENSIKGNNSNKYYANALRGPINSENFDNTNTRHKRIGNIYEETVLFNNIPQNQCHNMNCHLFCTLDSSNNPFRFVEADLYYLRFIKGGVIVRDLIPVLTKNGIPGLYDKAHKKFYRSQGDEDFVVGPTIS